MTAGAPPRAAREAAQPSLWDRLVNDLPGLNAEIDAERRALERDLGAARVAEAIAGGPEALDGPPYLAEGEKERLRRMRRLDARRAEIEARGIVVSAEVLREAVRRDIEALFNTERFACRPLLADREAAAHPDDPADLADYPAVRRSAVNYGVPPFAGRSSRDFDREALAREIRDVLAAFEPRLRESATRVSVTTGGKAAGLSIEIDALLIMAPAPERLRLRTLLDLDGGRARTELRGR